MTGIRSNKANGIKRFGQEGGYYVAMVGNVTEHAVKKYRQEQARKEESEESANRSGLMGMKQAGTARTKL